MRTIDKPAYRRWLERYHWARARRIKSPAASMMADHIGRFREFAVSEGFDPDALGDFARYTPPICRAKSTAHRQVERRVRYRELRDLGATPEQANLGSGSTFSLARMKRELSGAFRNPGQRERCGGAALPPRHEGEIER